MNPTLSFSTIYQDLSLYGTPEHESISSKKDLDWIIPFTCSIEGRPDNHEEIASLVLSFFKKHITWLEASHDLSSLKPLKVFLIKGNPKLRAICLSLLSKQAEFFELLADVDKLEQRKPNTIFICRDRALHFPFEEWMSLDFFRTYVHSGMLKNSLDENQQKKWEHCFEFPYHSSSTLLLFFQILKNPMNIEKIDEIETLLELYAFADEIICDSVKTLCMTRIVKKLSCFDIINLFENWIYPLTDELTQALLGKLAGNVLEWGTSKKSWNLSLEQICAIVKHPDLKIDKYDEMEIYVFNWIRGQFEINKKSYLESLKDLYDCKLYNYVQFNLMYECIPRREQRIIEIGLQSFHLDEVVLHEEALFELYLLSKMYVYGLGTPINDQMYKKCLEVGAAKGCRYALNNLGSLYRNGIGVIEDPLEASRLFFKSAEKMDPIAQFNLGFLYYHGYPLPNLLEAEHWLKLSADQNIPEAQFYLGCLYGERLDYAQELKYLERSAMRGCSLAQNRLGYLYYTGNAAIQQNFSKAYEYFLLSAVQDNESSQYNLGNMYENGFGVKLNREHAMEWYRRAYEQGNQAAHDALERLGAFVVVRIQ